MTNDTQDRNWSNQPVDKIYDGNLKATIWRNEGEKGPFYTTEFTRTYKDADGNVRDAHSFIGSDQLKLAELARKSYERTTELRREEFHQNRQNREPDRPHTDRNR